jgi:hypothetical protein
VADRETRYFTVGRTPPLRLVALTRGGENVARLNVRTKEWVFDPGYLSLFVNPSFGDHLEEVTADQVRDMAMRKAGVGLPTD